MKFYRSNRPVFYGVVILGLINSYWIFEPNRMNNAIVLFLAASNVLMISAILFHFLKRIAFSLENGTLKIIRLFNLDESIPLSAVDTIEWNEYPENSFLRLHDGSRIKMKVSDLNEETFTNFKSILNKFLAGMKNSL